VNWWGITMYESFFNLKALPFKITPDPAYIYWDKDHRRAASVLAFGIEQLVPITVVTGDVGTGKTTLLQQFLEDAPAEMTIGLISNYWSGMGGLYQWILNAFDIQKTGSDVEMFRAFEDFILAEYAAGRRCVLIVDEAQNVSDTDLEQLRMLTNINVGTDSLFMLFLVGQQQLRDRLLQPNNRQIAQRVGAAFHLGPMALEDTKKYVRHRISVAGGTREIFDDAALEKVHEVAGGVPRLTNVVCELALVTAFGGGVKTIDRPFMDEFVTEAIQNGLVAHLPMDVAQSDEPPAETDLAAPDQPAVASAPIPFRSKARAGQSNLQNRLNTEPWLSDQVGPVTGFPQTATALAIAVNARDHLLPTTPSAKLDLLAEVQPAEVQPEQSPAQEKRTVQSFPPVRQHPFPALEKHETAPEAAATGPDAKTVDITEPTVVKLPTVTDEPKPDRPRRLMFGILDEVLNAAVVMLAVGVLYWTVLPRSEPDLSVQPLASLKTPAVTPDPHVSDG